MLRQLEAVRDELAQAKPRLASLMNLEPGRSYTLAVPDSMRVPELQAALSHMEETALMQRPELIEARYNERISVLETRKALARLLPGIEISLSERYDSNRFLVDNQWTDAGLRVSWNLFNVLSGQKIMDTAEAQVDVARTQRLALNMAVLSQVHIAYRDYLGRKRQYELATGLDDVSSRILQHTRNAVRSDAQGKMAEIRAEAGALFSELRRYQTYGGLHNAYGAMLSTLGTDPLPEQVAAHDLKTLTKAIAAAQDDLAVQTVKADAITSSDAAKAIQ
jgi:outer membrane protein TolC